MGPENQYSGSADWGGISVWSIKGDKFEGTFVAIDDDNKVVLMNRRFDKNNEENIDKTIMEVEPDDHDGIYKLLSKAKEISATAKKSSAKIPLAPEKNDKSKFLVVKFKQWNCFVVRSEYRTNDRTSLTLINKNNGQEITVATVNIPEAEIEKDEVIIKNILE